MSPVRALVSLVSLMVLVACLTVLFLTMRAVMAIGGYCASGGPYAIRVQCPEDVVVLLPVSIVLGLLAAFVYASSSAKLPGPRLWPLAWPALFLSLGWNFLEFGLDPPFGAGPDFAWLLCAVVFFVMGLVPLGILFDKQILTTLFWNDPPSDRPVDPYVPLGYSPRGHPAPPTAFPPFPVPADFPLSSPVVGESRPVDRGPGEVAESLERLSKLHADGALSDKEFTAAKKRILEEE